MRPRQFKYHSGSMAFPCPRDSVPLKSSKFHATALGISSLNCQREMEGYLHLLCLAATRLPIATQAGLEATGLQLSRLVHERPGKSIFWSTLETIKWCKKLLKSFPLISTSQYLMSQLNWFFCFVLLLFLMNNQLDSFVCVGLQGEGVCYSCITFQ